MNILLVSSPPSNRGGISNWVRLMHTYINAGKAPGVNLRQIRTLQYKNLKHGFWERYVRNGLDIFRIRRELEKELRTQRPDIIHVTVTGDWSGIPGYCDISVGEKTWNPQRSAHSLWEIAGIQKS